MNSLSVQVKETFEREGAISMGIPRRLGRGLSYYRQSCHGLPWRSALSSNIAIRQFASIHSRAEKRLKAASCERSASTPQNLIC